MGQFNFNSQPAPWSLNWLQQFLYSLQRSWWARCSTTAQLWLPQSTTPSTTPHPPPTPLHPPHMPQNITKEQEEHFDYKYYTGASKGPSPYDATHWIGPEGYPCPSEVDYAKITRAVNVEGYWRIILQHIPEGYGYGHYNYTQTTRLETCLSPDSACRLLAPC